MRKVFLMGSLVLLTSCSSIIAPKLTSENLVGEWYCKMDYTSSLIRVYDYYTLNLDGSFTNKSTVLMPTVPPTLFRYKVEQSGHWKLSGDKLHYDLDKSHVSRSHNPQMQELLKTKKEKVVNEYEEKLFKRIVDSSNVDHDINLIISNFNKNKFTITQKFTNSTYVGECISKEKFKENIAEFSKMVGNVDFFK